MAKKKAKKRVSKINDRFIAGADPFEKNKPSKAAKIQVIQPKIPDGFIGGAELNKWDGDDKPTPESTGRRNNPPRKRKSRR